MEKRLSAARRAGSARLVVLYMLSRLRAQLEQAQHAPPSHYVSGPRPCDACTRAEGGIGVLVMTTSDEFDAERGLQNHLENMDSIPCMVVVTVDFKDKRPDADSERNRLDWIRNNSGSLQRWAERFENMSSGRTSILVEAINVHTCRSQDWTKYFHVTTKCLGPYNSWCTGKMYR
jgi:hypothetical protein